MPMSEQDVLQRLTSVALIVGGILTLVANAIYPRASDAAGLMSDVVAYSENEVVVRLGALSWAVGMWVLVAGLTNTHHFIRFGAGAAWARLGFYQLVIGSATMTVSAALALGALEAAITWGAAPVDQTFSIAGSLYLASSWTFDLSIIAFWTALLIVAIAWTRTDAYPRWGSWSPLVLGLGAVAMGWTRLFVNPGPTLEIVFAITIGLTSIWAIAVGGWAVRKAWHQEDQRDRPFDAMNTGVRRPNLEGKPAW